MLLTFAQMIFVPPKWGGGELPVHFTLPPPSLLGLFIYFFSHHADICIFYFNFLFESDLENPLAVLF